MATHAGLTTWKGACGPVLAPSGPVCRRRYVPSPANDRVDGAAYVRLPANALENAATTAYRPSDQQFGLQLAVDHPVPRGAFAPHGHAPLGPSGDLEHRL